MSAGVGHIGSSLCIVEILAALYGGILNLPSPSHPDRDRFVLSKGHAALALYAALHLKGWVTKEQLASFCADGTHFGVHPEPCVAGIDFGTGSLGQGLTFATGAALAGRRQQSRRRAFVLMSDAELNEGSVWEAIMFAAHHKLSNLVAIVDLDRQQAFGYTRDVIDLSPVSARWSAFGWDVKEVDGHDVHAIADAINTFDYSGNKPHVLIAHTTFGKGVSFMEGLIKWHYSPLSAEEFRRAMAEVSG